MSELDWLENHKNADEIVYSLEAGRPIKAIYSTIRGIPRKFPAVFYYLED